MRFLIFNFQFPILRKKGFTLVEVLVGVFLILIVFLGIFGAYQLGFKVLGQSKNKIIATFIANAEIEKIRNLSYSAVGVEGSFPDGVLEPVSEIIQNGIKFRIERRVDYIVDPVDGIAPPEDDCPNDYKKVEIKVLALGRFATNVVTVTDISPKNLAQECDEEGGILSVTVFDALGVLVSSPLIEIKNPETNINLKTATPFDGKHYFSLSASTYKVVVSKNGYSSERTYGASEVASPLNPHPIVLEGQLTELSLSIDKVSSFAVDTITREDDLNFAVPNTTFNLKGSKIIGHDENEYPVYKYSRNHTSNSQGHIDILNLEWDNYIFSVVSPSNLNLIRTEPGPQPVFLFPNANTQVNLVLSSENALLVTVLNSETSLPIFSAQVRLINLDLEYDAIQYTNENGQTYFIPLEADSYDLQVSAAGYLNAPAIQVLVSGNTASTVQLNPDE